ncbi:MAG: hypothetical protein JL50_04010 [Peptococcaceae bacterium BICA1-7]|nr:MAG: hypothetical protein JL50_04010 [Peptococcaceae bacterium BICA1-7]HBV97570.1 hypothetical protein [Desulfotomaculum sp.]
MRVIPPAGRQETEYRRQEFLRVFHFVSPVVPIFGSSGPGGFFMYSELRNTHWQLTLKAFPA